MIWVYIIGAIMAQAIVVALLMEFINRRSVMPDVAKAEPSPPPKDEEPKSTTETASAGTNAIGVSTFSYEDFCAMRDEIRSLKTCIEGLMEMKDVEFAKEDKKIEETEVGETPDGRMSPEQEASAWEDHRDEEAQLDREDNTMASPNPLASGADFDDIVKANVIMETADGRTPEDLKFAMNIIHTLEGTQFCGCLPDALLEKLHECHRRAELRETPMPEDNIKEEHAAPVAPSPVVEEKPQPQPEEKQETKTEETQPQTRRFSYDFVNKTKQKQ